MATNSSGFNLISTVLSGIKMLKSILGLGGSDKLSLGDIISTVSSLTNNKEVNSNIDLGSFSSLLPMIQGVLGATPTASAVSSVDLSGIEESITKMESSLSEIIRTGQLDVTNIKTEISTIKSDLASTKASLSTMIEIFKMLTQK